MRSNVFKLSAVAATIAASFGAQAAIYKVVEVTAPDSVVQAAAVGGYSTEFYGTAVVPAVVDSTVNPLGCFDSSYKCNSTTIAAETRNWPEGLSYREEVPFAMDNGFDYANYDQDDFESYCSNQLKYAICDTWADEQYAGYEKELIEDTFNNSIAFIEGGIVFSNTNGVINELLSATQAVGNLRSTTDRRNTAKLETTLLLDPERDSIDGSSSGDVEQTLAFASDGTMTVGSVSRKIETSSGDWDYYSRPVIWNGSEIVVLGFGQSGSKESSDELGQGSIRDFYVDSSKFYGVGYNTYKDQRMDATIFTGNADLSGTIVSKQVSGATSGDDYIYSNSVVSSINQNRVAVGSAKRAGNKPADGSANNRLFYVEDVASPTATYFSDSVFFNSAGGTIGAINNFNEVVGSVDLTSARELDGSPRPKRGFINPLNVSEGTQPERRQLFENRSWLLDDLTNDGIATSNNNNFRILDASDINDAGVISATALKCEGGYDSTDIDSYCQSGAIGSETVVAVKLIPIADAASSDIQTRGFRTTKVEREGGSLGWFALGLLALLGFRRK
ncbi:DUF3466 family protein [Vibrio renipiscarius]|uniref:DUF3466 family protein n=1 Tax=Vibrio renipiscarius TaxID=1461322 RepID=UPI00354C8582